MPASYARDNAIVFTVTLTNAAGVAADPVSTLSATVRSPDGTTKTYVYLTDTNFIRTGLGVFTLTVLASEVGQYGVHAWTTGAGTPAVTGAAGGDDTITIVQPPII